MTIVGSPPGRASDPAASLPRPVVLCIAGAASIVAVIVLAIAVRTSPFPDLDEARENTSAAKDPSAAVAPSDDDDDEPQAAAPAGNSRELRAQLSKEVRAGKVKDAAATLTSLVAADPRSPEDADVRNDILELASKAAYQGGAEADKVFEVIGSKMGTRGPDVLYALVTSKGGSKAADRAVELLKQDDVRARATPATRIAFDLWAAKSCPDKAALLDRARTEGDSRALGWVVLMGRNCKMSKDPKLKETLEALKSR
ncbi:hypothetical protein [Polyangium jinanense]|uniref:Uncharacterized protein n=1 Tax=Polyangium jinanense TaxID=2829994 RepID=A0A9X3XHG1_9BACT|nr:hypothetical protein [Polyangium jinanense]MDC3962901.1 hypothetical protein [Polyangium jinanense]MDC3989440.1 hypothetical protein [Polyangium jinanense]